MSVPSPRWLSSCYECHREREIETRLDHGARTLCDECASKPPRKLSAVGLDAPREPRNDTPARATPPASSAVRRVELTAASDIRSERLHWVWTDRMPRRSLVVVAGEKGLGKSLLTNARLPALVTQGELDGELRGTPADVLVVTAEDDWASVVKPRLTAHGADLDRVHRVNVLDENGDALLTLPDDVPRLEQQIKHLRDTGRPVAMLVIDPIGAFLAAGTDTHRDASVRRALAPLAAMAERLNLVIVVVAHLTKDESGRLINRVSGAGAFVNAARSVLALARDPGDPNGEQGSERVLLHVGSNWGRYAPTLAWRVEGRQIEVDDGSIADVGYLLDKGETDVGVEDVQRGPDENGPDAEEAIGAALARGARPSSDVKAGIVDSLGCSRSTIDRAAKRMAGRGELVIAQGGYPRTTTWTLGSHVTPDTPVASSPNSISDVTDSHTAATGISAPSGVIGVISKCDDATDATDDDEARLARAQRLLDDAAPLAAIADDVLDTRSRRKATS